MNSRPDYDTVEIYKISVRGHLDQRWADWFDGFTLDYVHGNTLITGPVPDQAALHGVLSKIRDLGLPIRWVAAVLLINDGPMKHVVNPLCKENSKDAMPFSKGVALALFLSSLTVIGAANTGDAITLITEEPLTEPLEG